MCLHTLSSSSCLCNLSSNSYPDNSTADTPWFFLIVLLLYFSLPVIFFKNNTHSIFNTIIVESYFVLPGTTSPTKDHIKVTTIIGIQDIYRIFCILINLNLPLPISIYLSNGENFKNNSIMGFLDGPQFYIEII